MGGDNSYMFTKYQLIVWDTFVAAQNNATDAYRAAAKPS